MPKVEIDTAGVTVRLEASESSITDLSKQALDLYRDATAIERGVTPLSIGFGGQVIERRGEGTRGYGTEWSQPLPRQEANHE